MSFSNVVASLLGAVVSFHAWRGAARQVGVLRASGSVFGEAHFTDRAPVGVACVITAFVLAHLAAVDVGLVGAVALLPFLWSTVRLSLVDVDTHVVPISTLIVTSIASVSCLAVASAASRGSVREMAVGTATMWCLLWLARAVSRGDLGWGDVMLAAVLGPASGRESWTGAVAAVVVAFMVAGVVAGILVAMRRTGRRGHLPFVPFLFVGVWTSLLR